MPRPEVAAAYDARADEYIASLGSIEQMAAEDRATIEKWRVTVRGRVLDAGCGPGHWSEVLSDGRRNDVVGVDASARFIRSAQKRFPHINLVVGDLAALPLASASLGGVLSWFSIIHTAPTEVVGIIREFARVLAPGGSLLLGFFDGIARSPFDHAVTTAYYWSADALGDVLTEHGFVVERAATRQDPGSRRQGDLLATLRS